MVNPVDPASVIASAVVPVVLMSAGGLLVLALYNRLAAIMNRLRSLVREQVHDEEVAGHILKEEIPRMLHRARLVRNALSCLLSALALLGVCSFAGGLSRFWNVSGWIAVGAFLSGQMLLVAGLLLALMELRQALAPVKLETRWAGAVADERE